MPPAVRYLVFAGVSVSLLLGLIYSTYEVPHSHFAPLSIHVGSGKDRHSDVGSGDISLQQVLQFIYNPSGFNATTPSFSHDGKSYNLPSELGYTAPLGKEICILDVDTRPFDSEHQIFHDTNFDFSKLDPHSSGILNHYMYAQTHGYSYKFIRATPTPSRHPTWVKVPALAQTLSSPSYKFVVFLDADALFNNMHIPLEWLLNYWSITPSTSLALALDPSGPQNTDAQNRRLLNTGFIIAQNNPRTHDIMKAWDECPSNTHYANCSTWNKQRFHEQSAFGEYVRYEYEEAVKELPCDEANGEWDFEECKGVFVQHMWWRTENVGKWFGERTVQSLMERMHERVLGEKEGIVEVQGSI